MAKFSVVEMHLKQAHPKLGSSFWSVDLKQGGFESAEYDTADCMITLVPGNKKPGLKKRRIHVSNTIDLVYGVTTSSKE